MSDDMKLVLLLLCGALVLVAILYDALGREPTPPDDREERAARLLNARQKALAKMAKHRIKPIDKRESIGVYKVVPVKPEPTAIFAIRGGKK